MSQIWYRLSDGPIGKVNHQSVQLGNNIYIFGGHNSRSYSDSAQFLDVIKWNIDVQLWQIVHVDNKCRIWDCQSKEFKIGHLHISPPFKRYGHSVVEWDGKAWLFGGRNDEGQCCTNIYYFTPETSQNKAYWTVLNNYPDSVFPYPVDGHSSVVIKNQMIIFGGFSESNQSYNNYVFMFDLKMCAWRRIFICSNDLSTASDISRDTSSDLEDYFDKEKSQATNTWVTKYPLPREFGSLVKVGDRIFLFGGRCFMWRNKDLYCSILWELIPILETDDFYSLEKSKWNCKKAFWKCLSVGHGIKSEKVVRDIMATLIYDRNQELKYNRLEEDSDSKSIYLRNKKNMGISDCFPLGRRSHSCWSYLECIYISFGVLSTSSSKESSIHFNDLWKFDIKMGKWFQISLSEKSIWPIPRRRASCSLVTVNKNEAPFVLFYGGAHPHIYAKKIKSIKEHSLLNTPTDVLEKPKLPFDLFKISLIRTNSRISPKENSCILVYANGFIYQIVYIINENQNIEEFHMLDLDYVYAQKTSSALLEFIKTIFANIEGLNFKDFFLQYFQETCTELSLIIVTPSETKTYLKCLNVSLFSIDHEEFSRSFAYSLPKDIPNSYRNIIDQITRSLVNGFANFESFSDLKTQKCDKIDELKAKYMLFLDVIKKISQEPNATAYSDDLVRLLPGQMLLGTMGDDDQEIFDSFLNNIVHNFINYDHLLNSVSFSRAMGADETQLIQRMERERNTLFFMPDYGIFTMEYSDVLIDSNNTYMLKLDCKLSDLCLQYLHFYLYRLKILPSSVQDMIPKGLIWKWSSIHHDQSGIVKTDIF